MTSIQGSHEGQTYLRGLKNRWHILFKKCHVMPLEVFGRQLNDSIEVALGKGHDLKSEVKSRSLKYDLKIWHLNMSLAIFALKRRCHDLNEVI